MFISSEHFSSAGRLSLRILSAVLQVHIYLVSYHLYFMFFSSFSKH